MKMTTFDQHAHDLTPAMKMMRDNAILSLCARLQAAAIKCDDYHVFVSYAPHVGALSVVVRNSDHDYAADVAEWPIPIVDEYVYINEQDAMEKLTSAIDSLQRLGIDV